MALTYGTIWGDYGDEKVTGTTKLHPFGTRMVLPDSRVFYYGQTDGAQTAGAICQSAVGVANHDMDLATNTASVGDKSVTVTVGGTAGSGEPLDRDASGENDVVIGTASLIAPVTTDYGYVNLTINP